ncbi:MAG TPA: C40 family peptidase, partial [Flavobacteriaceae bacterium]|nr:C40 family peptidase [Flavobacteriaceae bacterium]
LLYGETFVIVEEKTKWTKIKLCFDYYIGWINNKQFEIINEDKLKLVSKDPQVYSYDLVEFIENDKHELIAIPLGSNLNALNILKHKYDGNKISGVQDKSKIVSTALRFLNSPYSWGGRTPFGIDCSGFTQMVYKLNGYKLERDSHLQAKQGSPLSFIEESEPGDLAFFDNDEGKIIHVGIIMDNNHIIHASGKVRIDRIDQTGVYNSETKTHTHNLRVIKKII